MAAEEAWDDDSVVDCVLPDDGGDETTPFGAVGPADSAAESGGKADDPGDDPPVFEAAFSGSDGDEMASLRVSGADEIGDKAGVVGDDAADEEDGVEAGAADEDAAVEVGGGDDFRGGQYSPAASNVM